MSEKIIFRDQEGILYIGLNKPEKLNALDEDMWRGLTRILKGASEAKPIIIYGVGKAFSAGDDIKMMFEYKDGGYIVNQLIKPLIEAILEYEMPVIAAVDGYAFGAGLEILLLMDVVVSSPRSVFSVPEARIGLIPPLMLSMGRDLPGLKRAVYLTLTGRRMDAEEAYRYGIVDIIDDDPLKKATEVAKEIMRIPRDTIMSIKRFTNTYRRILYDERILDELSRLMSSEEALELMKRFLEKRL